MNKNILTVKNKKFGFTLVESLVAITILLIAVVGPLTLVSNSIATANLAKDQIKAYYFAQEAVEMVRNIRDTNVINARDWLTGLDTCASGCAIDAAVVGTITPTSCTDIDSVSSPCKIYRLAQGTPTTRWYTYTHSTSLTEDSGFRRQIFVTPEPTNGSEAEVTVVVKWVPGAALNLGSSRTFSIKDRIYDW